MKIKIVSIFMILASYAVAAQKQPVDPSRAPRVIDLGQLDIEGEVRRPNMNWVDSQKRVKEMIPSLHRDQFQAVEGRLLRPASVAEVRAAVQGNKLGVKNASH